LKYASILYNPCLAFILNSTPTLYKTCKKLVKPYLPYNLPKN
jgi:hypothetical protein